MTASGENAVISTIVEQHAEEAAFLWSLRAAATDEPHFDLRHLAELEARLEAHLDGLRVAGDVGWTIARARFEEVSSPGDLFPVVTLALDARDDTALEEVLDVAADLPDSWRGLFGAIGWAPSERLRGRVARWLNAQAPFRRLLGAVACSLHRTDPGSRLVMLLDDEPIVRRRALRLAGEMGRTEVSDQLRSALDAEDVGCRFWASWSLGLTGDRSSAIPPLMAFATNDSPFRWVALEVVLRLMDWRAAVAWLRELGDDTRHARLVVVAVGILGLPAAVPWLIEKMQEPELARVAAESFSMITGVDLSADDLQGAPPSPVVTVGPTDDPDDDNVAVDPDENLPWPDVTKIHEWWHRESSRLAADVRHLRGMPIGRDASHETLRRGFQRERRAASYELAIASPGQPLWNWRAKASEQLAALGVSQG